ncbi:MAG: hypothetical protein LUG96_11840 [Tannerellaceae bacterium]|nr:hypothetical protein [Tannerellaceae bacterium]
MAEEMREDIYLELNQRIQYFIRRVFYLKIVAVAASFILLVGFSSYISYHEGYKNSIAKRSLLLIRWVYNLLSCCLMGPLCY